MRWLFFPSSVKTLELFLTMFVFLLACIVIVIYAFPHNHGRDNLFLQDVTEDSFSPVGLTDANIFDDGALLSSAAFSDDDSTSDPINEVSVGTLNFGQNSDVKDNFAMEESFDPSLFGVNDEGNELLVSNSASVPDSYDADKGFPSNGLDTSISTALCNLQGDSSFENLESSSFTTLTDLDGDSDLIASDDLTPKTPEVPDAARHVPSWRYTKEPLYELDPNIGTNVQTTAAYASNGTPLKPDSCPPGHRRSCCTDDTHTECWHYALNKQSCRYARRLFCCQSIPQQGGPGTGCQTMKWVLERTRPLRNPPSNQPDKLQGIFDIFQFPDLSPNSNPGYCPNPSHL